MTKSLLNFSFEHFLVFSYSFYYLLICWKSVFFIVYGLDANFTGGNLLQYSDIFQYFSLAFILLFQLFQWQIFKCPEFFLKRASFLLQFCFQFLGFGEIPSFHRFLIFQIKLAFEGFKIFVFLLYFFALTGHNLNFYLNLYFYCIIKNIFWINEKNRA